MRKDSYIKEHDEDKEMKEVEEYDDWLFYEQSKTDNTEKVIMDIKKEQWCQ